MQLEDDAARNWRVENLKCRRLLRMFEADIVIVGCDVRMPVLVEKYVAGLKTEEVWEAVKSKIAQRLESVAVHCAS